MPQITLEYTDNVKDRVEFHSLLLEVHKIIAQEAGINIDNCKSRTRKLDCYLIGAGGKEKAFVNLDLYTFEDRPLEVKKSIGKQVLKLLEHNYQKSIKELDMQITVKVADIMRDTYFKYPSGTFTHA